MNQMKFDSHSFLLYRNHCTHLTTRTEAKSRLVVCICHFEISKNSFVSSPSVYTPRPTNSKKNTLSLCLFLLLPPRHACAPAPVFTLHSTITNSCSFSRNELSLMHRISLQFHHSPSSSNPFNRFRSRSLSSHESIMFRHTQP